MHQQDELRRIDRVGVCCRVDVRDRFGVWTAVTEDMCDRGCRLVTAKLPRVGSMLEMTISSDLFPESLEVLGRAVWVSPNRVGVAFLESADRGLPPAQWIARLVEHGRVGAPGPRAIGAPRIVPVVQRTVQGPDGAAVVRLPITRR